MGSEATSVTAPADPVKGDGCRGPLKSRNNDDWDGGASSWRVAYNPNGEWALWLRGTDPRIEAARTAARGG